MKNLRRALLVLLAGVPLLYLPLRAAEPQDAPPSELPPADTPPASPPADVPPASGSESPVVVDEAAASEEPEDFGERVSADNNLSFPVDI